MLIPDKVNLLYIEDDESNVSVVKAILGRSRHTEFNIVHKYTLKDGLEYLKTKCPGGECFDSDDLEIDVILLDLVLPNSHGVDTYKQVIEVCSFIPIVIISGHEEMACDCVKLGAQDYLVKPDLTGGVIIRALKYAIERNKLEKAKLESEGKFREVINSTPIGFHNYELKDGELIFRGYNPAANKILDINNKKFIGKRIQDAFPNLANTEIPERYTQVAQTGKPWNGGIIEYEDKNINKGYFRVHVFRTSPGFITASFEDVTQQMLMEKNLKRSEARYRYLVEVAGAAIFEIDFVNEKFVYVNDVMCKLIGWSKRDLLKMSPTDILTETGISNFLERQKALKNGEYIDNVFEYQARTRDGKIIWGLVTSEFIEDENGDVVRARGVSIDITDKKMAELEAKNKEEMMFNELENRIHQWRKEISVKSTAEAKQLEVIDNKILMFTNTEVV